MLIYKVENSYLSNPKTLINKIYEQLRGFIFAKFLISCKILTRRLKMVNMGRVKFWGRKIGRQISRLFLVPMWKNPSIQKNCSSTFYLSQKLNEFQRLKAIPPGRLTKCDRLRLCRITVDYHCHLMFNKNIIVSTCVGAGHRAMRKQHFDAAIIDEATKDVEPIGLLPILLARKLLFMNMNDLPI